MKRELGWRTVSREELAQHLQDVEILSSEAIGETSAYRCRKDNGESIAVSLPNDMGLIIEVSLHLPKTLDRRRIRNDREMATDK